ncbi:M10 family metallopeptidase C-terminal domain-containing protein [Sphingomonas sp. GCM10030256]|uniref:M10 family metallopeptidase C-terminal domain-containing protein n=1 Tax=Sphingomonas sp. GCM10030256 TaxID=3273427 RepID=UPI003616765B
MSSEIVLHNPEDFACACPACSMPIEEQTDSVLDAYGVSLDTLAGTNHANGKAIWSADQVAAHLNRTGGGFLDGFNDTVNMGRQNNIGDDNKVVTFGFFENANQLLTNGYGYTAPNAQGVMTNYALSEYFNFASFNTVQRDATREIMTSWDDVAAVSFRETNADDADMNFGNLASAPTTQAYARIPTAGLDTTLSGQVREVGGDSWISASQASNFQLDEGGYGMQTLLHEAGHGLGLSHPGGYNAAPGRSITYTVNAEYAQDTRAYSVMSYFNASSLGARHFDFHISGTAYSSVPLIHDIAAIQKMYGADMTTRTGDTVYGFNSNAGRDAFDFNKTPAPIGAIWDAGGNDTIDASGFATDQVIDLTPGSLSSIGGVTFDTAPTYEQVVANRTAAGISNATYTRATYDANMAALQANAAIGRLTDNFGIAYGAVIENAIGGSGHDNLIGNQADNLLKGNAGNDIIGAGAGNDILDGGIGNDTMLGGRGDDLFFVEAAGDVVTELADEGVDTVSSSIDYALTANVENLVLTGLAVSATGNELDNVLTGNAQANQLVGGAGNDRLIGGDGMDWLTGGAGSDTFVGEFNSSKVATKLGSFSIDRITDFQSGVDKIDLSGLDAISGLAGDQAFTFRGMAANKNAGELTYKVYDSVQGAEMALGIDIDGQDKPSTFEGPVTILFGNVDGGTPDFAVVLFGVADVNSGDFFL